ncbi:hypothetical protein D3C80_2076050 [compost metagenome]
MNSCHNNQHNNNDPRNLSKLPEQLRNLSSRKIAVWHDHILRDRRPSRIGKRNALKNKHRREGHQHILDFEVDDQESIHKTNCQTK